MPMVTGRLTDRMGDRPFFQLGSYRVLFFFHHHCFGFFFFFSAEIESAFLSKMWGFFPLLSLIFCQQNTTILNVLDIGDELSFKVCYSALIFSGGGGGIVALLWLA